MERLTLSTGDEQVLGQQRSHLGRRPALVALDLLDSRLGAAHAGRKRAAGQA
jgi:hypothetical protein